MVVRKVSDIVIRPKRQVTLPKDICDQLGIDTGDVLELTVENSVITARPRKTAAPTVARARRPGNSGTGAWTTTLPVISGWGWQ